MRSSRPTALQAAGLLGSVILMYGAYMILPGLEGRSFAAQGLVGLLVILALPLAAFRELFRWDLGATFLLRPPRPAHALAFPVLAVLLVPALEAIAEWICRVFPSQEEQARGLEASLRSGSWMEFLALVLVFTVATAVLEEALFRGALVSGWQERLGAGGAVTASAIFFGLIHAQPFQQAPAFLAGLFLGWAATRTGSLWPAVLGHAAVNLLALVAASFLPDVDLLDLPGAPLLVGGSLAAFAAGVIRLERGFREEDSRRPGESRGVEVLTP